MKEELREARLRLRNATRTEYDALIYEAKLTPLEEKITRLHIIDDLSVAQLMERFSCSDSGIRSRLNIVYERVSRIPIGYENSIYADNSPR